MEHSHERSHDELHLDIHIVKDECYGKIYEYGLTSNYVHVSYS